MLEIKRFIFGSCGQSSFDFCHASQHFIVPISINLHVSVVQPGVVQVWKLRRGVLDVFITSPDLGRTNYESLNFETCLLTFKIMESSGEFRLVWVNLAGGSKVWQTFTVRHRPTFFQTDTVHGIIFLLAKWRLKLWPRFTVVRCWLSMPWWRKSKGGDMDLGYNQTRPSENMLRRFTWKSMGLNGQQLKLSKHRGCTTKLILLTIGKTRISQLWDGINPCLLVVGWR